jgi:hypothetical protein
MCNLSLKRHFLIFIFHFAQIDAMFICKRIKNIHMLDRIFSSLLETVYKVNPIIYMVGNEFTLQLFSKFCNKFVRIIISPAWQNYVVDYNLLLCESIMVVIDIDVNFRKRIQFRNQLSQIGGR